MFLKNDSSFPDPSGSHEALTRFVCYYEKNFKFLPTPIYSFFTSMIFVICALNIIRLLMMHRFSELREFYRQRDCGEQQKRKSIEKRFQLLNRKSQNDFKYLDISRRVSTHSNAMLSYDYEMQFKETFNDSNSPEMNYANALKSLVEACKIIKMQEETIIEQAKIIKDTITREQDTIATEKHLHNLKVATLSASHKSYQQLAVIMFHIITEQNKKIDELESKIKGIGDKNQTSNACQVNSERGLARWQSGPLQNILLCAFYLGHLTSFTQKKLQRKEVEAICLEIAKSTGDEAHGEALQFLWKNYRQWPNDKGLMDVSHIMKPKD